MNIRQEILAAAGLRAINALANENRLAVYRALLHGPSTKQELHEMCCEDASDASMNNYISTLRDAHLIVTKGDEVALKPGAQDLIVSSLTTKGSLSEDIDNGLVM